MADLIIGHQIPLMFVDKRKVNNTGAGTTPGTEDRTIITTPDDYEDIEDLKAVLVAADSAAYSANNTASMTVNDLLYAGRLTGESSGI